MRAVILLACLAGGCSFTNHGGPPGDDGDDAPPSDAAVAVPDAPACADGDADGDGVCDAADRCPGQDDRLDADRDLVPDGCDDWPCGAKPGSPSNTVSQTIIGVRHFTAGNIDLGTNQLVVAARDATVPYELDYGLIINCFGPPTCQAQLEIGLSVIGKLGCVVDRSVGSGQVEGGVNVTGSFQAPSAPATYDIRLNAARAPSCATSAQWYSSSPDSDQTIGMLCVH